MKSAPLLLTIVLCQVRCWLDLVCVESFVLDADLITFSEFILTLDYLCESNIYEEEGIV